ncbi:hypothetical protein IO707_000842 [Vibrio vulnificus]|nr:hypothetical protein [Vibrio vulnificus]
MKSWKILKELSTGKLISSTSIWIFLVPAIAKLTDFSESIVDGIYPVNFVSPTSLVLLYLSAVSFFLASLIYIARCPSFIKQFDNYLDFEEKKMSIININSSLTSASDKDTKTIIEELNNNVDKATTEEIDSSCVLTIISGKERSSFSFNKDKLPMVFWPIYGYHLGSRCFAQFFCWLFYIIGFSIMIYIFVSNFIVVINSVS